MYLLTSRKISSNIRLNFHKDLHILVALGERVVTVSFFAQICFWIVQKSLFSPLTACLWIIPAKSLLNPKTSLFLPFSLSFSSPISLFSLLFSFFFFSDLPFLSDCLFLFSSSSMSRTYCVSVRDHSEDLLKIKHTDGFKLNGVGALQTSVCRGMEVKIL